MRGAGFAESRYDLDEIACRPPESFPDLGEIRPPAGLRRSRDASASGCRKTPEVPDGAGLLHCDSGLSRGVEGDALKN